MVQLNSGNDNKLLAIGSILVAVLTLSFGDAIIKSQSNDISIWQLYVARSVISLPILVLAIRVLKPGLSFLPVNLAWTAIRSLLLTAMWVAYYMSLPYVNLSIAAAIYYTIPIFIALLSAVFTEERVTLRSWVGILIGFIGVLVIVRPNTNGFNYFLLLPLLAALLYATAMILTRTRCLDEKPEVLSFSLNVSFLLVGVIACSMIAIWGPHQSDGPVNPFILGAWQSLSFNSWMIMAVLALVIILGSYFAALAYQKGPSSMVATYDYTYLLFSAIWGWVFFSEAPDLTSVLGMIMIAGGGIIASLRRI